MTGTNGDYLDRVEAALAAGNRTRREDVRLLAEEARRCRVLMDEELSFRDLEVKMRDGSLSMKGIAAGMGGSDAPHPAYRLVAAMLLHMLLGEDDEMPPNYRSCEFEVKPGGEFEGMRVIAEILAPGGKSSHTIRRDLEAEVEALKAELNDSPEVSS